MAIQQLSGGDALFLNVELEDFPMHIGGVSIYDQSTAPGGKVRFKDILKLFASRLDRSPIFRRKLLEVPMNMDQPYWVDDENFDLEFHVRHIALPKPGDWRQLCIQVARLHARPLDRGHPLWEVYVIEGLNNVKNVPKGSFALYLKVHHCAMDGASGVQFFGAFNDLTAKPEKSKELSVWQPDTKPSKNSLLRKAYANRMRKSLGLMKMFGEISPTRKRLKQFKESDQYLEIGEKPMTRFNGKLSPHRVVDAVKFDFAEIREIKNTIDGATINDAVLAIVSGAMRKYLDAKGEMPEQSMVTGCPIDVRDETEKDAGGNMIGLMTVDLCSTIDDPRARFQAIHDAALSAKAHAEALGPRIGMDIAETVSTGIQSAVIRLSVGAGLAEKNVAQNTMVTNVPGSPVQLYCCGAKQIDAFGIGPVAPGMGLFHTVGSFVLNKKGSIIIAFVACRESLPDPEFYAQCLSDSYNELRDACLG